MPRPASQHAHRGLVEPALPRYAGLLRQHHQVEARTYWQCAESARRSGLLIRCRLDSNWQPRPLLRVPIGVNRPAVIAQDLALHIETRKAKDEKAGPHR